ncbi:multicopper oxidase family protein [Pseudonocardia alaniniphila]|uniref:Multicopper oxidase CueO n=1 Tax=Pseudonocardia alaniniphila TaxID=75291 RepID=A0ABS9T916_9PSEU|nr:multicopper oxidase domain-containing protein [Pseudonocardia alaniniphila]MCH6165025.1 multicopper oxidase domain-containing protein [Pseudonocardia alaniniphila]
MNEHSRRSFIGFAGTAAAAVYGGTQLLSGDVSTASAAEASLITPGSGTLRAGPTSPQVSKLTPFMDPLQIPPTLKPRTIGTNEINIVAKKVRLHSQLPPTPMWTYEGSYPGPTIEVQRGQRIRIAWRNALTGTSPVKGVFVPPSGPPPGLAAANAPGADGAPARRELVELTPWTSVHVHGGSQHAVYDGLPESGITPGDVQLSEYTNESPAAHLFYHDHAMPITAVNVAAGLVGNYIVRDAGEDRLGLPSGAYEIPLMLSDINFDTDSKGLINGQILIKRVQLGPAMRGAIPAAVGTTGPFTMVNGVVWPHLQVEARAYRFRMVNTSLTRAYALAVLDEKTGRPLRHVIRVIGTDGGLLGAARTLDEMLTINPGERVDIVIDFAGFPNRRLRLVNTDPSVPAGKAAPAVNIPFPDVMQFRVGATRGSGSAYRLPKKLSDFKRITAADVPKNAVERFVMLAFDVTGMPKMWELVDADPDTKPGAGIIQIALPGGTRTFRVTAQSFEETTNFFGASGSWEKWHFLNVDQANRQIVHPMHIHVMNFQLIERRALDPSGLDTELGGTTKPIGLGASRLIAASESGWKDVVGVPVNEMVTVAGRFDDKTGRYVYHCHILDHEDEGMMRPLVLMPPAVLNVQNMMMKMMNGKGSG